MRHVVALALAALVATSGCLSGAGKQSDDTPGGTDDSSSSTGSPKETGKSTAYTKPKPSGSPNSTQPSGGSGGAGGGGGNATPPQTTQKPWPAPDQARIRPGDQMEMRIDGSTFQCTSNFVFRSPDNATLYLGTASHCVDGLKIGDSVTIDGATKPGKLAYSAWIALKLVCDPNVEAQGCTGGQFQNDFALVAIDAADRPFVSPAVEHFGGPTALADSKQLDIGDRVLVYGHSGLWQGQETLHRHEGVVSGPQGDGVTFYQYTVGPGIQGDSGSGVLTRDGRAAGILVTIAVFPPAESGVTGLKLQLELAKKNGMDVSLATWAQLDDGLLPG